MYKKHSIEERLLAVQKCLEGYTPWGVGRMLGIKEHYVSEWLDRYRQNGIAGLQKRPNKHADFAEKCKIVCEYAEKSSTFAPELRKNKEQRPLRSKQ
ncbi:MAG: helix-turn-helix domain-containing protein [Paludibacteraceae bacterium]|nr:helix-turn-helix domain-containing protein [Paludibacteraceae bacterium]